MTLIVAGYTAAPADPEAAQLYYRKLATVERAGGLGLAWKDAQTVPEIGGLLAVVPDHWVFTLNAIPRTYQNWAKDHRFGLASPDEDGRQAALAMARSTAEAIRSLNDKAGRRVVLAVEVQSAPGFSQRDVEPSAAALARSLVELADLAWEGTSILVEHCDALVPGQTPAKGFLTLSQEIEILSGLEGAPVGLSLNWGRSLIEVRDPDRVIDHVRQAQDSGLLRAFTFSGTAATASGCGVPWQDSHLAFADPDDRAYSDPASLMTVRRGEECLAAMSGLQFLAVKTNWPAGRTDPEERADSVIANTGTVVAMIDRGRDPVRH